MFRRPTIYARLCHGHSRGYIPPISNPKSVCPKLEIPHKLYTTIPTDLEMLIILNVMNVAINLTLLCTK